MILINIALSMKYSIQNFNKSTINVRIYPFLMRAYFTFLNISILSLIDLAELKIIDKLSFFVKGNV